MPLRKYGQTNKEEENGRWRWQSEKAKKYLAEIVIYWLVIAHDVHGSVAVIKSVLQVDDDWNIKFHHFQTNTSFRNWALTKLTIFFSPSLWQCVLSSITACRRWKLFALLLILQRKRIQSTLKKSFFYIERAKE